MNEDYRQGYKDGFDDGYEKGKREAPLPNPLKPIWDQPKSPFPWGMTGMQYDPRCGVCGMRWDKPMGYVCNHPDCPTKMSCVTNDTGC